jgi:cystathionine gamma-synthase
MSAVMLALTLVNPGQLVIASHDCYGGTHRLLRSLAARGHFQVSFEDLTADGAASSIRAQKPAILWIETPSNPLLRISDIALLSQAARDAGSIVVVDNTFLSPALQTPLEIGADIVVHSTTKYLNGHSDVVGGAVVAKDAALGEELAWWANCLGITGAPFDSFLTLRGIRTLDARIRIHEENAGEIARTLVDHPAVVQVYYPGLPWHPGHSIAQAQQSGFGGMISFEIGGGVDSIETFIESLECFTLAESLGGVESLIAHPATMTHASMLPEARETAGIGESLLRLSVGIEHVDDLIADLVTALDAILPSIAVRKAG